MSSSDLELIPALFEHASNVYAKMLETSQVVTDDDGMLVVYEGHLTGLFKELRLSIPYYTSIKNQLIGMECIAQTRRGGGNAKSRWVLLKTPTLEDWKAYVPQRAIKGTKTVVQEQQIKDLGRRITELESLVGALTARASTQADTLIGHYNIIKVLSEQIEELKRDRDNA